MNDTRNIHSFPELSGKLTFTVICRNIQIVLCLVNMIQPFNFDETILFTFQR